jgi:hypothetical protein
MLQLLLMMLMGMLVLVVLGLRPASNCCKAPW